MSGKSGGARIDVCSSEFSNIKPEIPVETDTDSLDPGYYTVVLISFDSEFMHGGNFRNLRIMKSLRSRRLRYAKMVRHTKYRGNGHLPEDLLLWIISPHRYSVQSEQVSDTYMYEKGSQQ